MRETGSDARILGEDAANAVPVDVLIVGAGPTGLALATQLQRFGTSFRIIDRSVDRVRESRALAVQARTLELLDTVGLADALVARGRTGTRAVIHLGARAIAAANLGAGGAADTRYPFVLFVSQMETEQVLADHLARAGVAIERGVELTNSTPNDTTVACMLRHRDGREEGLRASYVVGADGAHSTVRKQAGLAFSGGTYPQDFMLGDVDAEGSLTPGAVNAYGAEGAFTIVFPLGTPKAWRVIALRSSDERGRRRDDAAQESTTSELALDELQAVVSTATAHTVTLRDPAWLTHFRLHHRQTANYRRGRLFVAGDAAHIHSPVGGQGMNTGIQDAWNLGWKLSAVAQGMSSDRLLDTYEAERWPVGRFLLRYTDRFFSTFTRAISAGPVATVAREVVAPCLVPRVLGSHRLGAALFRFVSELGIRYRESPAVREGTPRLARGPRAGDRLPDGRLTDDGRETFLQRACGGARLTLLLCVRAQPDPAVIARARAVVAPRNGFVALRVLSARAFATTLHDASGTVLELLGVDDAAQYLVRPDGYIAFRCRGLDLRHLSTFLDEWFARPAPDAIG